MGRKVHIVTNVDRDSQVGDCAHCGPSVPLKRMTPGTPGKWRCRKAYRENNRENRNRRARKHRGTYLVDKASKCPRCGFEASHPAQMDVHHKNRDHSDNRPENLEVICANCHRLEHAEGN